jgi:hypothetical protein
MNTTRLTGVLALVAAAGWPAGAATPQSADQQHTAIQKHGEKGMGFDETRTSHHFRLSPTGGTIEVHVGNPDDRELRDQVVTHLKTIAEQFAHGDFSAPFTVHAEEPAGVPALKRLRPARGRESSSAAARASGGGAPRAGKERFSGDIVYTFVPDDTGGRVLISTGSKKARAAVHAFLRYQIREHRTGDSLKVSAR